MNFFSSTPARGAARTALAALSFVLCLGACHASPAPSLQDPVARLPFGVKKGTVTLKLKIEGLDEGQMADKALLGDVFDAGHPAEPTKVKKNVAKTEILPTGATTRYWDLAIDVDELPPNSPETRTLRTVVAGKDVNLDYTLTNEGRPKFTWTVKPSPTSAIHLPEAIQISIAVGPAPATNVIVLQSALIEKTTKAAIAKSGLHLCRDGKTACSAERIDLPPNSSNQLWLWGADRLGQFDGSVTVGAAEKPEGDTVSMTVYTSTTCAKVWGIIVIFGAVVLTWFCTSFLRNQANRDRMLLPVSALLTTLKDLTQALSRAPHGLATAQFVQDRINLTRKELSISNLSQNGLPSKIPLWGVAPDSTSVDSYRKYVQARSDWVQALRILVREGLEQTWSTLKPGDEQATERATAAVHAIDALANVSTAPTADATHVAVQKIIAPKPMVSFAPEGLAPIRPPEDLLVSIDRANLLGWIFLLMVTTLSGAYIFVLGPNGAGFGTAADFVLCALWGCGLPAGAQLMQSTTGTISATFK